jgi:hypothetical protein
LSVGEGEGVDEGVGEREGVGEGVVDGVFEGVGNGETGVGVGNGDGELKSPSWAAVEPAKPIRIERNARTSTAFFIRFMMWFSLQRS